MAKPVPQTFANHVRFDPLYHYVLAALLLTVAYFSAVLVYRLHDLLSYTLLVFVLALVVMTVRMRTYSLKVQDRVIRLEERLRLMIILPPLLHHRIAELTEKQLAALRFASDQELMALTARTLEEKLDSKQIKAAIVEWRPDYFRV